MKNISKKDEEFSVFIEKLNIAYKERERFGIAFVPVSSDDFLDDEIIYVLYDGLDIVAGACVKVWDNFTARIRHVFVDVNKKRKGYAFKLISQILGVLTQKNLNLAYLTVIGTYLPAINLYKKLGFKKVSYFANKIGQPYGIKMYKNLGKKGRFIFCVKCFIKRVFSKLKFTILYSKKSTPKLLYKILYINK